MDSVTRRIFFWDPKNQNITLWMSADGFIILAVVLWRNSKMKFLLTSMKPLTNCENSSSNPLQRACSGFLMAACDSKSCSVSRLWFWKLFRKPVMNVHWRKSTNESQVKPEQKFYAAYGTISRISKCFQRGKIYINCSLEQDRLKTICACTLYMYIKYWFDFIWLSKNYLSGGPIPLNNYLFCPSLHSLRV